MTAEKHKGRLHSKGQKSGVNKGSVYTSGEKKETTKNSGTVVPFNATKNLNTAASTSTLFCSHFYAAFGVLKTNLKAEIRSNWLVQKFKNKAREQGNSKTKEFPGFVLIINGSLYTRAYIS